MIKKYIPIIFLFTCVISSTIHAGDSLVPEDVYTEISRLVLSNQYRDAEKLTDGFINGFPDEPAGPLLKAAVLQYECSDYEDFSREDEFLVLIEKTENLARKKLESNSDDLWAQYYLAAAEGLKGVWIVSSGRFVRGVIKGRSGAKGMEKIVSGDSTFYDAYLMLGSYRFWKNVALDRFSWLPFIEAERNNGINEVKIAVSKGKLSGPLSNTVLLEMLLEHDPTEAVEYGRKLAKDYPSCRLFAWQLGEAYKKLKRYDDAVRVFTGIAESMANDEADDGSGQLRCWWKLAVLSKSVGKKDECLYYCNKVIELGRSEPVYKRQKKRIKRAQRMVEIK